MFPLLLTSLLGFPGITASPPGTSGDQPRGGLDPKEWVGEAVFPREPQLKLRQGDTVVGDYDINRPHVLGVSGKRLRLRSTKAAEGYVSVDDVVKLADANSYYSDRINQEPNAPIWYWFRSNVHRRRGELDKALLDLNEGIKLDRNVTTWWVARSIIFNLKKEYRKAIVDCDVALRLNPKNVFALVNRGINWVGIKEYDKAITDFSEALKLDPRNATAYHHRARVWRTKGETDKALADFDEALQIDPKDSFSYLSRGLTWKARGDRKKAMADYDQAISHNPKFAEAYLHRADLWSAQRFYEKALADYESAERFNPKVGAIYIGRSYVYRKKGMYEEAQADCKEAMRLSPESAASLQAFAWLLSSCPDAKFRDGKRAVALATKACELTDWKYPSAISALAAAYAEAGDFDQAIKYQKQALTFPDFKKEYDAGANRQLKGYENKQPNRDLPIKLGKS